MEGMTPKTHEVMKSLEVALDSVSDKKQKLEERLGPALATILHTTSIEHMGKARLLFTFFSFL